MKLELKHLAPYLLNDVICSYKEDREEKKRIKAIFTGISKTDGIETTYKRKKRGCSGDLIGHEGRNNIHELEFKLHLRPLSDLGDEYLFKLAKYTNELEPNISIKEATCLIKSRIHTPVNMPYIVLQKLFEWHFDVFGLIEKGLAIDIKNK